MFIKKCLKMPMRLIKSLKSRKDRQCNGQKKKDNDLLNITQKTKD